MKGRKSAEGGWLGKTKDFHPGEPGSRPACVACFQPFFYLIFFSLPQFSCGFSFFSFFFFCLAIFIDFSLNQVTFSTVHIGPNVYKESMAVLYRY